MNCLPTKERVKQRFAIKTFKHWKVTLPFCVNELFVPSRNTYKTRSHMAFQILLIKSSLGQKSISFLGPSIWNKLSNDLKILNTPTSFTHNYKKVVLKKFE